jgi:hypothetical protein
LSPLESTHVQRHAVLKLGCEDWMVAVAEDLYTIAAAALALHVVTRLKD